MVSIEIEFASSEVPYVLYISVCLLLHSFCKIDEKYWAFQTTKQHIYIGFFISAPANILSTQFD